MQGLWYVALLAAFASLNSCNLGFDLGVTAGAILGMQADLGLTDDQVELFVGMVDLSGTIGAACSFLISDYLGRRRASCALPRARCGARPRDAQTLEAA